MFHFNGRTIGFRRQAKNFRATLDVSVVDFTSVRVNRMKSLSLSPFFFQRESCSGAGKSECGVGKKEAKLKMMIRSVNDRPILNFKNYILFPPVPENVSDIQGKCVKVSVFTRTSQEVLNEYIRRKKGDKLFSRMAAGEAIVGNKEPPLVEDPDNREVGVAITGAPKQRFGLWQFKTSDGILQQINITSGMVLLLKPTDCIMFNPNGGTTLLFI